MALVCDIKSSSQEESSKKQEEIDLEDGEIEDDEEDPSSVAVAPAEPPKPEEPLPASVSPPPEKPNKVLDKEKPERDRVRDRLERVDRRKHDDKGKRHMTEAEKSILHLRKREEAQRKKWEKMRLRDVDPDDDFAKNIEKTLATILNKKEKEAAAAALSGGEEKDKEKLDRKVDLEEEDKRGRKRRKNNKDRKNKQRRLDSPKSEIDESEMMNIRGGSPDRRFEIRSGTSPRDTPSIHSEESYESGDSSDRGRTEDRMRRRDSKKGGRRNRDHGKEKHKNRDRDKKNEQQQPKDSQGVCIFYLQGKCQKTDCLYSHEAVPQLKLELCKFYLMDCCAKGDKCSYMHSEFPCKFYHTGLNCLQGENCKFSHGKPLSDGLKQILFKHIETAPRDLLGGFPRVTREEALDMINVTQAQLQEQLGIPAENKEESKGGIPSLFDINVPIPPELLQGNDGKGDKLNRHRQSRWQEPDPMKTFNYGQDQDMRINSNGDIDMRTLPPPPVAKMSSTVLPNSVPTQNDLDLEKYKREAGLTGPKQDFDIRHTNMIPYSMSKDVDIRNNSLLATKDVDIRHIPPAFLGRPLKSESEDESGLQIDTGEETQGLPKTLPKTQRDLFMRIQSHQKENVVEAENKEGFQMDDNINWYSDDDDDDDNRLTIKVDNEDVKEKEEPLELMDTSEPVTSTPAPMIKPQEVVEKLGDLSKIDISAEVTKLLTSMSQNKQQFPFLSKDSSTPNASSSVNNDPRTSRQDPRKSLHKEVNKPEVKATPVSLDPRLSSTVPKQRSRQSSSESQIKSEKISIYEQGSIDRHASTDDADIDIRSMRSDVDLRSLQLSFKGIQNYTPASEIDASINSHPPMVWKLAIVEIPRPDYTGLKLSINDAEKTGDPRLRKIFRLSTEERDTPLSPKASPKAQSTVRVDPRLRKIEENKSESSNVLNFSQQLNALQSSAFYQNLTSNQKVHLNQELNQRRNDPTNSNSHDPVLNCLLSNLNIIPNSNLAPNPNLGTALAILANISKLNSPMVNKSQNILPIMGQNPVMMNQNINQPGLLGAAPGIPNLPPDFSINFDPRNGGLLGNAPIPFGGFPPPDGQNFNNFNDDYYPPEGGGNFQGNHRDNRGFNRDRRRGRHNFNRNSGNRNFRNRNRGNRHHSPP